MPKLIVLATCRDVTFDENQTPSLYHIFIALDAGPIQAAIPESTVMPQQWKIFTMWRPSDSEIGKHFRQHVQIFTPNGSEYGNGAMDFSFTQRSHYNKMNVNGIPIGVEGNIIVKTWLESGGKKVTDVHTAEINVRHVAHPRPVPQSGPMGKFIK